MLEFIKRLFSGRKSKDVAKERLQLVLVQDRMVLDPDLMDKLRQEMVKVISRHVSVDREGVEVDLVTEDESVALLVNIPVREVQRRHRR